ncbi:hypothetical protein VOLCADRAFT_90194 [Volvox carteri f. nagariensis]|uniref:Uncharacterized protein n=1 Tax=Volvox carteri f. nagariensis TaxID=3068 RepID=D8TTQ9_VOLCA|nr:uncharacterized protein VOLCADRAFT_90194 [Volvox carteri f. nagariensis]EFJ49353.1 hypothetical protein VOLCADRAFT_90194 [Volvox carteri f. nagariensis]|eukprot:XP_002949801.1 hypothetical protein VOLCADRAFT_90194 [Volvox carteri f. nagariensis]
MQRQYVTCCPSLVGTREPLGKAKDISSSSSKCFTAQPNASAQCPVRRGPRNPPPICYEALVPSCRMSSRSPPRIDREGRGGATAGSSGGGSSAAPAAASPGAPENPPDDESTPRRLAEPPGAGGGALSQSFTDRDAATAAAAAAAATQIADSQSGASSGRYAGNGAPGGGSCARHVIVEGPHTPERDQERGPEHGEDGGGFVGGVGLQPRPSQGHEARSSGTGGGGGSSFNTHDGGGRTSSRGSRTSWVPRVGMRRGGGGGAATTAQGSTKTQRPTPPSLAAAAAGTVGLSLDGSSCRDFSALNSDRLSEGASMPLQRTLLEAAAAEEAAAAAPPTLVHLQATAPAARAAAIAAVAEQPGLVTATQTQSQSTQLLAAVLFSSVPAPEEAVPQPRQPEAALPRHQLQVAEGGVRTGRPEAPSSPPAAAASLLSRTTSGRLLAARLPAVQPQLPAVQPHDPISPAKLLTSAEERLEPQTPVGTAVGGTAASSSAAIVAIASPGVSAGPGAGGGSAQVRQQLVTRITLDRRCSSGRVANLPSYFEVLDLEISSAVATAAAAAAAAASVGVAAPTTTSSAISEDFGDGGGGGGGGGGGQDSSLAARMAAVDTVRAPTQLERMSQPTQAYGTGHGCRVCGLGDVRPVTMLAAGDHGGNGDGGGGIRLSGWPGPPVPRLSASASPSGLRDVEAEVPTGQPSTWAWRAQYHYPPPPPPPPQLQHHQQPASPHADVRIRCWERSLGCGSEGGSNADGSSGCSGSAAAMGRAARRYPAPPPPSQAQPDRKTDGAAPGSSSVTELRQHYQQHNQHYPHRPNKHTAQRQMDHVPTPRTSMWQAPPPPPPPLPPPPPQQQPRQAAAAAGFQVHCDGSLRRLPQREPSFPGRLSPHHRKTEECAATHRGTSAASAPSAVAGQCFNEGWRVPAAEIAAAGGGVARHVRPVRMHNSGRGGNAAQQDELLTPRTIAAISSPFGAATFGGGSYPAAVLAARQGVALSFAKERRRPGRLPTPPPRPPLQPPPSPPLRQQQQHERRHHLEGVSGLSRLDEPGWLDCMVAAAACGDASSLERMFAGLGDAALTALMHAVEMLEAGAGEPDGAAPVNGARWGPPLDAAEQQQLGSAGAAATAAVAAAAATADATVQGAEDAAAAAISYQKELWRRHTGCGAVRQTAEHGYDDAAGTAGVSRYDAAAADMKPGVTCSGADDGGQQATGASTGSGMGTEASNVCRGGGGDLDGVNRAELPNRPGRKVTAASSSAAISTKISAVGHGSCSAFAAAATAASTTLVQGCSEGGGTRTGGGDAGGVSPGYAGGDDFHAPSSIVPLTLTTARTIRPRKAVRGSSRGSGGGGAAAATEVTVIPAAAGEMRASSTPAVANAGGEAALSTDGIVSAFGGVATATAAAAGLPSAEVGPSAAEPHGAVSAVACLKRGTPDGGTAAGTAHGAAGMHDEAADIAGHALPVRQSLDGVAGIKAAAVGEYVEGTSRHETAVQVEAEGMVGASSAAVSLPRLATRFALASPFAHAAMQALPPDGDSEAGDSSGGAGTAADTGAAEAQPTDHIAQAPHPRSQPASPVAASSARRTITSSAATVEGGLQAAAQDTAAPLPPPAARQYAVAVAGTELGLHQRTCSMRGASRVGSIGIGGVPDTGRRGSGFSAYRNPAAAGTSTAQQYSHSHPYQLQHQFYTPATEAVVSSSGGAADAHGLPAMPAAQGWGPAPPCPVVIGGGAFPVALQDGPARYGVVSLGAAAAPTRQYSWQLPYQVAQAVLHGSPFPGPSVSLPPPTFPYLQPHAANYHQPMPITANAAHDDVPNEVYRCGGGNTRPDGAAGYVMGPLAIGVATGGSVVARDHTVEVAPHMQLPMLPMASTSYVHPNSQQLHQQQQHPQPWPPAAPLATACPQPLVRQCSATCTLSPALFVPMIVPQQQQQQQQQPGGACAGMGVMVCAAVPPPTTPQLESVVDEAAGTMIGPRNQPVYLQPPPAWAVLQFGIPPYGGNYKAAPSVADDQRDVALTTYGAGAGAWEAHWPSPGMELQHRVGQDASGVLVAGRQHEMLFQQSEPTAATTMEEAHLPGTMPPPPAGEHREQQKHYLDDEGGESGDGSERRGSRTRSRPRGGPSTVGGAGSCSAGAVTAKPPRDAVSVLKWCHVQHSRKQAPSLDDDLVRELVRVQLQSNKPIRAPWYRDAATSRQQAQAAAAVLQRQQQRQREKRHAEVQQGTRQATQKPCFHQRKTEGKWLPAQHVEGEVHEVLSISNSERGEAHVHNMERASAEARGGVSVTTDMASGMGTGVFIPKKG